MKLMRAPKGEGSEHGEFVGFIKDDVAYRHLEVVNTGDHAFCYWLEEGNDYTQDPIPENWFEPQTARFVALRKWGGTTRFGYGDTQDEAEQDSEAPPFVEAWGRHTSLLVLEQTDQRVKQLGTEWAVYREVRCEG